MATPVKTPQEWGGGRSDDNTREGVDRLQKSAFTSKICARQDAITGGGGGSPSFRRLRRKGYPGIKNAENST